MRLWPKESKNMILKYAFTKNYICNALKIIK